MVASSEVLQNLLSMTRHAFTVKQANALIPHIRATFRRIQAGAEAAQRRADKIAVLDALWGDALLQQDNPDHDEFLEHRKALARIRRAIERLIQDRLTDVGIRLPTAGLDHGIVDFPSTIDGRWVYLCWHSGEQHVGYWHEIDAGFRGRLLITPKVEARLGLVGDSALEDDSALDF